MFFNCFNVYLTLCLYKIAGEFIKCRYDGFFFFFLDFR